jgi:hypothetical protein
LGTVASLKHCLIIQNAFGEVLGRGRAGGGEGSSQNTASCFWYCRHTWGHSEEGKKSKDCNHIAMCDETFGKQSVLEYVSVIATAGFLIVL